jgi:hypothetical protein
VSMIEELKAAIEASRMYEISGGEPTNLHEFQNAAMDLVRDHGQALVEAVEDAERLDWMARYGVSLKIESRDVEVRERRNAKWWLDTPHHTYLHVVDDRVRFDSYRDAIDAARTKASAGGGV